MAPIIPYHTVLIYSLQLPKPSQYSLIYSLHAQAPYSCHILALHSLL